MTELVNIIKNRRSIRKYKSENIMDSDINKLISAVKWSPSWTNSQCWEIVIIKNQETKKKLQKTLPLKGNPAKNAIVQAPILLAMCGKTKISGYYNNEQATKFGDWFMYDLGIATQSLCLMAHSMGLGTVIVGLYDHEKAGEIIGLPKGYELVTMIPVGYAYASSKEIRVPKRRNIEEIIHNDFF